MMGLRTEESNHGQTAVLDLSLLEAELPALVLAIDEAQGVKVATCHSR